MGFTEREQTPICPCYFKGEDFRKVVELKDCGLVIYCYTDHEGNVVETENIPTHTVVILQNTKNSTVASAELLPEIDKNKISCPRCKQILRHAQELLNKVPGIDKQDVMGICDHCRSKARTLEPCHECEKIVYKFLSTRGREKDTQEIIINRTHSEIDIDLIKLEISKSEDKLRTRKMFHSDVNLSNNLFFKKGKHKPLYDFEKGIHFTEFDKPTRIFHTVRSDSTTTVSHVKEDINEISQNTDHASRYKASKGPICNESYLTQKEINMQREITKYRHGKEELEVAIKTKEKMIAEFKKILKSTRQISRDFGLHKDFSFFFPEASQISLRKPSHVSSSQIIRFIQKKIGLKVKPEATDEGRALQKQDENDSLEEKPRQMKEKSPVQELEKSGINKQEILSNLHKPEKEMYSTTGKLEKEQMNEQKLIAEAEKPRKTKEEFSDTTVSKSHTTMKPKLKDEEAGYVKVPKTPISKEFKDKERKTKQLGDEKSQATYKDSTGVKSVALDGKIHATKKDTAHLAPERIDTVLKSERRDKGKEIEKSKTIYKSQDSSKKRPPESTETKDMRRHLEEKKMQVKSKGSKGETLEATQAMTHATAKETPRISTEKAGTMSKSGRSEKETEKSKKIQHFTDTFSREPKRIAEEKKTKHSDNKEEIIQVKSKDAKSEKLVTPQDKTHAIKKDVSRVASGKSDTTSVLRAERRGKEIELSQQNLKKLFQNLKHVPQLEPKHDVEKKGVDRQENKLQLEEQASQAKNKDMVLKQKKILPSEKDTGKTSSQPASEKADIMSKSEPKEKDRDKNIPKSKKKEISEEVLMKAIKRSKDISDKPFNEKEVKKLQHEEHAIEAKAKEALLKQNKIMVPEPQKEKSTGRPIPEKIDVKPKTKQKDQEPHEVQPVEVKMASIKKPTPSENKLLRLIVETKTKKADEKKQPKIDVPIDPKTLRQAKAKPGMVKPTKIDSRGELVVSMSRIEVRNRSMDDTLLRLIRIKQSEPRHRRSFGTPPVDPKIMILHEGHKHVKSKTCILCNDSELELKCDIYNGIINDRNEIEEIIIGENLIRNPPSLLDIHGKQHEVVPMLFKSSYLDESALVPCKQIEELGKTDDKVQEPEAKKGIIRYALSDRAFIEKGWTLLPTEKVVRKMNVYRMRPAHPEFDWFKHNKHKRLIQYDTCEKFAEFDDNGRGRWYYKNGRLALDYYEAEETNAQQRFVVYSSGEPDERGRTHPITVLATFDYLGNGIVLDHSGKIRLKYNQTEGVVLDRSIGPVSHWKWHTLNDPPVLQQVMIDTQMPHKDPHILQLGGPVDNKTRPDNEEMLAIEFDNFVKDKNKKLSQKFKPFQIKMKALKINEHFSLRVLDQATIYLIFRDGSTNLKLNIGMVLDHHEIVDTDTAEVGEVSNNLERFPARTDSLAGMQRSIAFAQRYERTRTERERRLRPLEPCASADELVAAASRPLRTPIRTVPVAPAGSTSNTELCRCSRKPSPSFYYNTRLT